MRQTHRERIGRLALFLLCVVLLSILGGVLLRQIGTIRGNPQTVILILTAFAVTISYVLSYAPGWLYKSLTEFSQDSDGGSK